ncbi:hypothetical protein CIL03_10320 [Virgibacillus indicus]|uniref:HTH cro/C1-type domain-containing protein n=1 Tax=Virgibacillus indicus TaxID=2024554 RepID=A0A265NA53_9BACI|nr:helix-turn-helix transcriptional regulator [Virgibacillus indicus]OZU88675.1 hypothetical protein CIL03_10320 [Virgibacillus indicus]
MKIKLKDVYLFKLNLINAGLSQRSYARKIGISESYANQIANGNRNPSPSVAKRTTELLGLDFNDIFFIEIACKSNHTI